MLLVVLVSLLPSSIFATPIAGPVISQPQNNSAGSEIASLDRQPQSSGNQDIQLISSSAYTDSIGSLHVIGELQNNSTDPRDFVKIVSTLRDPSDNILDSSFTYSDVEVLRPGEKSPFDVIFSNEQQVQRSQRFEISSITGDISQAKPANLNLNVGDSYYDSIDSAHVVGEVTNNGPDVSKFTKVSGTFYDDQNKIVATGFTYTDPSDLGPGQSAPFDMIMSDDSSANIASGSLNVQSEEYAMILPAAVFEMNGQSEGDQSREIGSLGGGPINEPPEDEPPEDEPPEDEPPEDEPPEDEPPEDEPPEDGDDNEDSGGIAPVPPFG
jgi:hypothetical protein